jgi:hypothetical protein
MVLSAALAVAGCSTDPPLDVAPNVDLSRFQGKWFEIAKLPRPTQTDCYGTAGYYSLASSDSLVLVNQCNVGSMAGPLRTVTMSADAGPADTLFADSMVARGLKADDDDSLHVALDAMARDRVDSDGDRMRDIDELSWGLDPNVRHVPQGDVAPPVTYGCSAAGSTRGGGAGLVVVAAAICVLARRTHWIHARVPRARAHTALVSLVLVGASAKLQRFYGPRGHKSHRWWDAFVLPVGVLAGLASDPTLIAVLLDALAHRFAGPIFSLSKTPVSSRKPASPHYEDARERGERAAR